MLQTKKFYNAILYTVFSVCIFMLASAAFAATVNIKKQLAFEENLGQFGKAGDYLVEGPGYNFRAAINPIIDLYRFKDNSSSVDNSNSENDNEGSARHGGQTINLARLQLKYVGANADTVPHGLNPVDGVSNYLVGENRDNWYHGIKRYENVRYSDLYPGIDAVYRINDKMPEVIFHIKPGVDAQLINMNYEGADKLNLTSSGALEITVSGYIIIQHAPKAWQVIDGRTNMVEVAYHQDENGISFVVGQYDRQLELVIDPVLDFSSYFGGIGSETVEGLHTDASGNIYLIATSTSAGLATSGVLNELNPSRRIEKFSFPSCPNCTDSTPFQDQVSRVVIDIITSSLMITKFSPDGRQRIWTTYFETLPPGARWPAPININSTAVSPSGEVGFALYGVEGLPLQNHVQSFNPDQSNIYVAKISSDGTGLVFASYLHIGTTQTFTFASQRGLDIGPNGELVLSGTLGFENELPVMNPLSGQDCELPLSPQNARKIFLTMFSSDGTLIFSSCIDGDLSRDHIEHARDVSIGNDGRLYLLVKTLNPDLPLVNPIQSTLPSDNPGSMYIAVINPSTIPASMDFSTYFGPSQFGGSIGPNGRHDPLYFPYQISADNHGMITVTGIINQFYFPVINAHQYNLNMPRESYDISSPSQTSAAIDLFITRIDPVSSTVLFSTYLGGRKLEDPFNKSTTDNLGNVYVTSVTRSPDYPVSSAIQDSLAGSTNLGITKFTPDGRMVWSTFLGGSDDQMFNSPGGIAISPVTGSVIVAANTFSDDFPTVDAQQNSNAGENDAVIAIIEQSTDFDTDGDGVIDTSDDFPNNADEWRDTDSDGVGDNNDPDIDGDGVDNEADAFVLDALWSLDSDNDGIGDSSDLFPNDPDLAYDFDGDGIGDFADHDIDGDGVLNPFDAFPDDPDRFMDPSVTDIDGDGIPNEEDPDIDNDGIDNIVDSAPFDDHVPIMTFNSFDPWNTAIYLSPLPAGFSTPEGTIPWTAAFGAAFSGDRSLGSRIVQNDETAAVEFQNIFPTGILSFKYKVDSELNKDVFQFLIDGSEMLSDSGDTGWKQASFPINSGAHTLQWRYVKDAAGSAGFDAVWIDDLVNRRFGDISVDIDNDLTTVRAGAQTTYNIPVLNMGTSNADAITLEVVLPDQYSDPTWTCTTISGGAVCPITSGNEPINVTFDLPAGGGLLYQLTVDVQESPEELVSILASLTLDYSFIDEFPANNSAIDIDFIGIFGTGFE